MEERGKRRYMKSNFSEKERNIEKRLIDTESERRRTFKREIEGYMRAERRQIAERNRERNVKECGVSIREKKGPREKGGKRYERERGREKNGNVKVRSVCEREREVTMREEKRHELQKDRKRKTKEMEREDIRDKERAEWGRRKRYETEREKNGKVRREEM